METKTKRTLHFLKIELLKRLIKEKASSIEQQLQPTPKRSLSTIGNRPYKNTLYYFQSEKKHIHNKSTTLPLIEAICGKASNYRISRPSKTNRKFSDEIQQEKNGIQMKRRMSGECNQSNKLKDFQLALTKRKLSLKRNPLRDSPFYQRLINKSFKAKFIQNITSLIRDKKQFLKQINI
jgi:hypothetical protein